MAGVARGRLKRATGTPENHAPIAPRGLSIDEVPIARPPHMAVDITPSLLPSSARTLNLIDGACRTSMTRQPPPRIIS